MNINLSERMAKREATGKRVAKQLNKFTKALRVVVSADGVRSVNHDFAGGNYYSHDWSTPTKLLIEVCEITVPKVWVEAAKNERTR